LFLFLARRQQVRQELAGPPLMAPREGQAWLVVTVDYYYFRRRHHHHLVVVVVGLVSAEQ
jgi:hypothetical protein